LLSIAGKARLALPPISAKNSLKVPWSYRMTAIDVGSRRVKFSNKNGATFDMPGLDDQDDMYKVKSIQKKFRDSWTQPLASQWDVVTGGLGATASVSAGVLTITSGTNPGAYVELLSKESFTIPFRTMIAVQSGATRQANTHHIIEAVSIDEVTLQPDGKHSLMIDVGGAATTTVTSAVYGVQNGGLAPLLSSASTIVTTASYSVLELEPFSDECYFHSRAGTGNVIRLTVPSHGYTGTQTLWVEYLNGVTSSGTPLRGNYVANVIDTNTLELQSTVFTGTYVGGSGLVALGAAPAASINFQSQFINCQDYAELTAEITAGRGQIVAGQGLGVNITGAASATTPIGQVTLAASQTLGTVTTVASLTSGNLGAPALIADVASAALTTTTTTAAITPTFGTSYEVNIPVTAVTGTSPTLDVSIEESDDNGTNWLKVYDFPRITAAGIYRSPVIPMTGTRLRYVQTVGGTTPSFTRAVNRVQSSLSAAPLRQQVDRSIVLTTLGSTTPALDCRDAGNRVQLVLNVGAITTTAPAIQLEGSDDGGASWYSIGTPLTAIASSTVQLTVADINSAQIRARVSTAGVGVTAGYLMIKAND
jgi:hypothetical protein